MASASVNGSVPTEDSLPASPFGWNHVPVPNHNPYMKISEPGEIAEGHRFVA